MERENILGVIGGMGPLASSHFYSLLIDKTPAGRDQDHIDLILLSHASMPDRTEAIEAGDDSHEAAELRRLLLADAQFLSRAGCRAYVLVCNTAHYFVHAFEDEVDIPFISMVREAAAEAAERFPGGRIAVLGTEGTLAAGIYREALRIKGAEGGVLDPQGQAACTRLIYDCVKAGKPPEPEALKTLRDELRSGGFDAAVLACTELSVLSEKGCFSESGGASLGIPYVDAMEVLARRAIEFMRSI